MKLYYIQKRESETWNKWGELFAKCWNFEKHKWVSVFKGYRGERVDAEHMHGVHTKLIFALDHLDSWTQECVAPSVEVWNEREKYELDTAGIFEIPAHAEVF